MQVDHRNAARREAALMTVSKLVLKRGGPPGEWGPNDFDVLEMGVTVGRIFRVPNAPLDRPWLWASGSAAR
jgi:hypothetical protein